MSTVIVEFCPKTLSQNMVKALAAIMVFAAAVSVAHCGTGCLPAKNPAEESYTDAIIACAATSGYPGAYDEAADKRCRAQVDCQYHVGPCQ